MATVFGDLSFGQKILHKMANDGRLILSEMADKSGVKIRIGKQIGSKYVVPTYAVVETESELDFVNYPREFALKPTHGSQAGILVHEQCKRSKIQTLPIYHTWGKYFEIHPDDLGLNLGFIEIMTKRWLNSKFRPNVEICYNVISPKIIVEKYIKPNPPNVLTDFRFYTFHGEVKFFRTATGYTNDIPTYAYDENGIFLPVKAEHDEVDYDELSLPELPVEWSEMKEISEKLSMGIDFLRIDFYLSGDQVYFSEFTHYPMAGNITFQPESFNNLVSSFWKNCDCCQT
jgi:TupA-like ATPgrasp